MSTTESLLLPLDAELLAALDKLARERRITRHEAARVVLRIGIETMRGSRDGRQLALPGSRP
jgi:hypothetical protein